MEFSGKTAIPRPTTRSSDLDSHKTPATESFDEEVQGPANVQGRAVTDSVLAMSHDTPDQETFPDSTDAKKKSRFNIIKSKLSFKDLRKESSKQDSPKEPTPQPRGRQTIARAAIPTPSSTVYGKKLNQGRFGKISAPTIVPSARAESPHLQAPPPITATKPSQPTTQLPQPASRIPLPPSGTHSNVQGTLSQSRRSSGLENRAKNSPNFDAIKDKLESAASPPGRTLPRRPVATASSRPSAETPGKKPLPKRPATTPNQQVAKDSPTALPDPALKEGNVKNLAKNFVDDSASEASEAQSVLATLPNKGESPATSPPRRLPSSVLSKQSLPSLHKKDEMLAGTPPRRLPSFQERLNKEGTPHDQGKQLESQSRITATDVNNMLDVIQSVKRQMEARTTTMNRKFEDLSAWVGDQLKNQIQSSADLSRTNSDLFTKQCQISREMMKLQLDIRLDISTLEQKLAGFENRVIDEVQNEVRSLARSYEELNEKTEAVIDKYNSEDVQGFIEYQIMKNSEVGREISYLKARQGNAIPTEVAPFADSLRVPTRRSLSTHGSQDPLIREPSPAPVLSYENIQIADTRSRMIPSVENKPPNAFPRSVSITKKGLLKGIKDIASGTADASKEKSPDARKPSEEPKKWNLNMFGLRRRRNPTDIPTGTPSKFTWSPRTRRGKDLNAAEEATSSRSSSPPIPPIPIPRTVPRGRNYPIPSFASDELHPAFRTSTVAPVDQSASCEANADDKLPGDLDPRNSGGSTDTFGHLKPRLRASGDRSRFTEDLSPTRSDKPTHTPDTIIHRTLTEEEQEQKDLTDTTEPDWDHVSIEESKADNVAN